MPIRVRPTEDELIGPAFTDIPGKEGYEDVTKRPDWLTYPEEPPAMKMPKKPKLEGFVSPDYSAEGKQRFENLVFEKIGGNPFKIDVMAKVNKASQNLSELFRHIFRGKVIWEDRGKLDKKQIDYWDDIVKQYRSDIYNQVTSDKAQKIEEHKWMMGQFDSKATEYKAAVTRARTAHEKITKEWKEARKPKEIKEVKKPTFDSLLGKLQGLRKKRADQEARITQMGYEYELTPSVKKAREMMDTSITRTERLMEELYPDLWKGYQTEEITEKYTVGEVYTDAEGRKAEYLGNGKWQIQK